MDYPGSDTADSPIEVDSNEACADLCQPRADCKMWLRHGTNCWLKFADDIAAVEFKEILGAGKKRECFYRWLEASTVMQPEK